MADSAYINFPSAEAMEKLAKAYADTILSGSQAMHWAQHVQSISQLGALEAMSSQPKKSDKPIKGIGSLHVADFEVQTDIGFPYHGKEMMLRTLKLRLRLASTLEASSALIWQEFVDMLTAHGEITSDTLMALAQKMFEIESMGNEEELPTIVTLTPQHNLAPGDKVKFNDEIYVVMQDGKKLIKVG